MTPILTAIVALATRTREVLSEMDQRIREDTSGSSAPRRRDSSDDRLHAARGQPDSGDRPRSAGRRIRGTQQDPHSRHSAQDVARYSCP